MINKPPINVQDGFFYQLRKDNTLVDVVLLSERKRLGRIKRFDKYALVLDAVSYTHLTLPTSDLV